MELLGRQDTIGVIQVDPQEDNTKSMHKKEGESSEGKMECREGV